MGALRSRWMVMDAYANMPGWDGKSTHTVQCRATFELLFQGTHAECKERCKSANRRYNEGISR